MSYPDRATYIEAFGSRSVPTILKAIEAVGYRAQVGTGPARAQSPSHKTGGESPHIAIIVSGSAAFAAAIRATESGAHVTMVESGVIGGTCVDVGYIPSKILIRTTQTAHEQGSPRCKGVKPQSPIIDWSLLAEQYKGGSRNCVARSIRTFWTVTRIFSWCAGMRDLWTPSRCS